MTAPASADATAARSVPAGAVTSTSRLAARPRCAGGPSGSTTVSRICIGVSGPFCAGLRGRGLPPTPHEHVGQYGEHPRTCRRRRARHPTRSDLEWSALPPKVPDQDYVIDQLRSVTYTVRQPPVEVTRLSFEHGPERLPGAPRGGTTVGRNNRNNRNARQATATSRERVTCGQSAASTCLRSRSDAAPQAPSGVPASARPRARRRPYPASRAKRSPSRS
ncbi:hypothetical protein SGPA1_30049 [Streptomyces misionensis JCM 4497]